MEKGRDVDRLQEEIEELFSELWQVPRFAGKRRAFRPEVDCFVTQDPAELTILVALPGVDPSHIHLDATPRGIVVSGQRPRPRVEGAVYQLMEIEWGPFERRIRLGFDVETQAARATYRDGLLTIVLPIAQRPSGPLQVPITVRTGT